MKSLLYKIRFVCCVVLLLVGSTALFASKPLRVISLGPSLTQSIYYMGAQSQLIGCTSYCHSAKGDQKEVVASAVKPNLEKIASLKPDLVLASGFTPVRDIETLRKLGIRVEVFRSPKSFDEICEQFQHLGHLLGCDQKAGEIIHNSRQRVNEIVSISKKRGAKPKVFMQIGASPIFTVIPNTFMDDYIRYNGCSNIASDLTRGTIGRELVVARRPDYIYIVTMGLTGTEEKAEWERFKHIPAVRNNRIFILDSDYACQPTPISFVQTLEIMHKQISQ
ncbi:MAG: ABC transporter substrate-binding protein [Bacteroidales bacterium]